MYVNDVNILAEKINTMKKDRAALLEATREFGLEEKSEN
jgi:hypothetical protein